MSLGNREGGGGGVNDSVRHALRPLTVSLSHSRSIASLGSSLILGLFLMFLARFAYLSTRERARGNGHTLTLQQPPLKVRCSWTPCWSLAQQGILPRREFRQGSRMFLPLPHTEKHDSGHAQQASQSAVCNVQAHLSVDTVSS